MPPRHRTQLAEFSQQSFVYLLARMQDIIPYIQLPNKALEVLPLTDLDTLKSLLSNGEGFSSIGVNHISSTFGPHAIDEASYIIPEVKSKKAAAVSSLGKPPVSPSFLLRKGNRLIRLLLKDLHYVQVSGKNSLLFTRKGQFMLQRSLKEVQSLFKEACFVRVHRNYLLNLEMVDEILLEDNHILLADGQTIPYSQRYKASLMRHLQILK